MHYLSRKILLGVISAACAAHASATDPVDYVNPYIGNISQLLVPTFPTIGLPNAMMRVYPVRGSFTESRINGLPLLVVNHRECHAMNLSAAIDAPSADLPHTIATEYDNESITPYYYAADIDNQNIRAEFSPAAHSAIYRFTPIADNPGDMTLILNCQNGEIDIDGNSVSGFQHSWGGVKVYIYAETDIAPAAAGTLSGGKMSANSSGSADEACAVLRFPASKPVNLRYAVSFISADQAKENLRREIKNFDLDKVKSAARDAWNRQLGKIEVEGGSDADRQVFYTSLYRCLERPVDIAEYGKYFCPSDRQIHQADHFYTDDWLWDTYRATHPLRVLLSPDQEVDIINSLIATGLHFETPWMPTFPAVSGDSHRMNCNHGTAVVADAIAKGLSGFDREKAFELCRAAIEDKTLAPWRNSKADYLNRFYQQRGYIPALREGEQEYLPEVDGWEKRQAVAVTLGTAYDQWCLSKIARAIGRENDADRYLALSFNYRNLFNPATSFFHPKDSAGVFIEPFDYRFSGGIGARDYYDENNGWTYRWDCQHNISDLISLMGGNEKFVENLNATFNEWLGRNRYEFYSVLPDQTGNVGQFTMGNEPSMHIPYLYNYAGAPWRTQKRVRELIRQWFRPDLMGIPGDEDGGGLCSFAVFSMMGFYPVTPGDVIYNIGTPFFDKVTLHLANGRDLVINAKGTSDSRKYIKSATLNGQPLNAPYFSHSDIASGAVINFEMTPRHTSWGAQSPSFSRLK